jgi:hypothetical protein
VAEIGGGVIYGRTAKLSFQMPTTAGNGNTNAAVIKTRPGGVFSWQGKNVSGTEYYLKLYNLARVPVVGTDVPFATVLLSPQEPFPDFGMVDFDTGIAMAITRNGVMSDTAGIVSDGDIVGINVFYD